MSARPRTTVVFALLLALCLSGAILVVRRLNALRDAAAVQEVLYVPSARAVKAMSLGYTGLMANIYWTRVVQYFGAKHHAGAMSYQLLAPLLDITTELDPHLLVAYEFGSVFLTQQPPQGAGDPEAAVRFVERGIQQNPNQWRLYFNLAFIHYLERGDYIAAAEAFERGAKLPNTPPAMAIMGAAMRHRAGDINTARALLLAMYQTTDNQTLRENALKRLQALQVEEDVGKLEELLRRYRDRMGRGATSWADLMNAGLLRGTPRDPLGHAYKLVQGRVEVAAPWDMPFLKKGLPPEWKPAGEIP